MTKDTGGLAFPHHEIWDDEQTDIGWIGGGMTLRDWFAGQALINPAICTGTAPEYQLKNWFGNRAGITREEIVSKQAYRHADAMLAERSKP